MKRRSARRSTAGGKSAKNDKDSIAKQIRQQVFGPSGAHPPSPSQEALAWIVTMHVHWIFTMCVH